MDLQSADFVNKMQILHGRFNFFSESADFVKDLQFAEILHGRFNIYFFGSADTFFRNQSIVTNSCTAW